MLGLLPQTAGLAIEQTGIRYFSIKNKKTWEARQKRHLPLLPGMIVDNQVADGEALLERVRKWVADEKLRGSRVSVSVPPSQIIIRKISIPSVIPKQVEQLVKLEVETGLHLPFDNPVYDYVTISVDEQQSHLLVFAAPRKHIQGYVELLENAGLKISGVELTGTALARSISRASGEAFEETMLIHLDEEILEVYLFHQGNPVFIRTFNLSELNRELSSGEMGEDHTDYRSEVAASLAGDRLSSVRMVEITAEISRLLNFYQYGPHNGSARIKNVLISGSSESRKQLCQDLRQSLSELEVVQVGFDMIGTETPDPELNDYRAAVGAAIHSDRGHRIDLMPREDRETILFPYIAIALVGTWLLGAIGIGLLYAGNQGKLADQEAQLQGLQDRGVMLQLELGKLRNSVGQLDRKAAVDTLLKYNVNAVSILDEMVAGLPPEAMLSSIIYTYRTSIDATVYVPSMEAASVYLAELRGMSFTEDAIIQRLTKGAQGGYQGEIDLIAYEKIHTAVYRVNMPGGSDQQQKTPTEAGEEGITDGTD